MSKPLDIRKIMYTLTSTAVTLTIRNTAAAIIGTYEHQTGPVVDLKKEIAILAFQMYAGESLTIGLAGFGSYCIDRTDEGWRLTRPTGFSSERDSQRMLDQLVEDMRTTLGWFIAGRPTQNQFGSYPGSWRNMDEVAAGVRMMTSLGCTILYSGMPSSVEETSAVMVTYNEIRYGHWKETNPEVIVPVATIYSDESKPLELRAGRHSFGPLAFCPVFKELATECWEARKVAA